MVRLSTPVYLGVLVGVSISGIVMGAALVLGSALSEPEPCDCTAEVEEAHHQEGEHYRHWESCERDVDIYVRQSMEAVCLDLYDEWNRYLDECYDNLWDLNEEAQDCDAKLFEHEVADQLRVKN